MKEERELGDIIRELYNKAEVPIKCRPYYPMLSDSQQLKLLLVLIRGRWIEFAQYVGELGKTKCYVGKVDFKAHFEAEYFDEALAGLTLRLWENLSETDKKKIQEILGGEEC